MHHTSSAAPSPVERLSAVVCAAGALLRAIPRRLAGGTRVFNNGRNDGPPDLDELWRDFNRKLSGLFGGQGGRPPSEGPE